MIGQRIQNNYKVTLFRSPGGDFDSEVLRVASRYGLQHVYWNVLSDGAVEETAEYVKNGVEKHGNGSIVLSHVQRKYDLEQAAQIIRELQDQSYNLTTVSEGIAREDNRVSLNPPQDIFPKDFNSLESSTPS